MSGPCARFVALACLTALTVGACARSQASCKNPCTVDGGTRCVGNALETCLVISSACMQWSDAKACVAGETCEGSACVDICATQAVVSACSLAAAHITSCCSVSFGDVKLCHDALAAGVAQDETALAQACTAQAQTSCADLHATYQAQDVCCCPDATICDYQTSAWQCAKKCTSAAECASEAGRPSCAPNENAAGTAFTPLLCKANDGGAYRGCEAGQPCNVGTCFADTAANDYCATTCTTDSDCGTTAQACCNLTQSVPAGSQKGCGPCASGGG